MLAGLDVGSPQGTITAPEWRTIRLLHLWAMLRLEQGIGPSLDPTFRTNLDGARAAAMVGVGAYCVFIPGQDPVAQAQAWFDACGGLGTHPGELPPAVDFEVASKTLTPAEELAELIMTIRTMLLLWGRPQILLYTYKDFWTRIVAIATPEELAFLAQYCLLWFAWYAPTLPATPPAPWKEVTFWQKSGGTGYHTPAGAPCDEDFFLGTQAELEALASFVADAGPNPLAGDTGALDIPTSGTDDEDPPT